MNIYDAAKKYKKIRIPGFTENEYLTINETGYVHVQGSMRGCARLSILSEDWEEYKEPRKYLENNKEAMQALIDGNKISKDNLRNGKFFILDKDGFIVDENGNYDSPSWPQPTDLNPFKHKFYVVEDE